MKRFLFFFLFALVAGFSAGAQNIIVTSEGDAIKAFNLEMTDSSVFYQEQQADDAPIKKIDRKNILIIKMQDGTKVDPNAPVEAESAPVMPTEGVVKISGKVAEDNAALIADFNKVLTWEPDAKFFKKGQGKIGNGYAGIMWVREDSQLYNGEVTVSYHRVIGAGESQLDGPMSSDYRTDSFYYPMVSVKVRNNTDKNIYLDLASCFVVCGDDSMPIYVPETRTVTNASSNSDKREYQSLEVTDNGISSSDRVHVSDHSSSVTRVREAQQFVTVAPKATLSLDPKPVCWRLSGDVHTNIMSVRISGRIFPYTDTPYGGIYEFDVENSPLELGSCVTYSFNADHSDAHVLRTELYLKYAMCTSSTALFAYTIDGDFHNRYQYWVPFYVSDN